MHRVTDTAADGSLDDWEDQSKRWVLSLDKIAQMDGAHFRGSYSYIDLEKHLHTQAEHSLGGFVNKSDVGECKQIRVGGIKYKIGPAH